MTYREAYDKGRKSIVSDEADIEAAILLEFVCNTERGDLFSHPERLLSVDEEKKYFSLIERRNEKEPVQYITGKTYFYGLEFFCDKSVLIPRFDTEVLVEEVIKRAPKNSELLDLCTGSGCIAICVKHEREDIVVSASDISKEALLVAEKNKDRYNLDIKLIRSDLFENIDKKFDIIVSNPPYIPTKVISGLEDKVKDFEPKGALDGGEDGLDFYKVIAKEAVNYLKDESILIMEIGFDQGEDVSDILHDNGYKNIEVIKDLNGLDRVVYAVFGGK